MRSFAPVRLTRSCSTASRRCTHPCETTRLWPPATIVRESTAAERGDARRHVVQGALGATDRAVKLITVKNKVALPLRACEIRLVYGRGFASQHSTPGRHSRARFVSGRPGRSTFALVARSAAGPFSTC